VRVGYFGSYARGNWGVGSDLDIVVIMTECGLTPERRGTAFDTITGFPLPVDLLVYTESEWDRLRAEGASFVRAIETEAVWVA
jgi:predicted nucleotidyltransferase